MTIPTIPSLQAGQVVQLSDLQNLASAATFALTKPMTKVRDNTGGAAIGTSFAAVSFTAAVFDTDGMWASGNPTRLTIQTPGWYTVRYGINVGATSGSYSACVASTAGANNVLTAGTVSSNYWGSYGVGNSSLNTWIRSAGDWPFYLYIGDYLQVYVQADATGGSTGTAAPGGATTGGSYFSLELVSI
jgi:hypothetical protein